MKPTSNVNAALQQQISDDLKHCQKIEKTLKSITLDQLYAHMPNAAFAYVTFQDGPRLQARYVKSGVVVRFDDKRVEKLLKTKQVIEVDTGNVVAAAIAYGVLGKSNVVARALLSDLAKPKPVIEEVEEAT